MGCNNNPNVVTNETCCLDTNLPKICLGAWAWGNDGTFGNQLTPEVFKANFRQRNGKGFKSLGYCFCLRNGNFRKNFSFFHKRYSKK